MTDRGSNHSRSKSKTTHKNTAKKANLLHKDERIENAMEEVFMFPSFINYLESLQK